MDVGTRESLLLNDKESSNQNERNKIESMNENENDKVKNYELRQIN